MTIASKVLVIDDEVAIQRFLKVSLTSQGYTVLEALTGKDGLIQASTHLPDLIVLDLGLPDMTGNEVLTRIREWSKAPVIILTVRDAESEKIALLDAGADDYLTKPFSVPELLARIRVALRHTLPTTTDPVFRNGFFEIDFANHNVTINGKQIRLTATEYKLLSLLARNAGKLLTQKQLLRDVWGPGVSERTQYLRVYMGQLRKKLEPDPTRPVLILTEPGVGYRMAILDMN